jgi:hypothetical protein
MALCTVKETPAAVDLPLSTRRASPGRQTTRVSRGTVPEISSNR